MPVILNNLFVWFIILDRVRSRKISSLLFWKVMSPVHYGWPTGRSSRAAWSSRRRCMPFNQADNLFQDWDCCLELEECSRHLEESKLACNASLSGKNKSLRLQHYAVYINFKIHLHLNQLSWDLGSCICCSRVVFTTWQRSPKIVLESHRFPRVAFNDLQSTRFLMPGNKVCQETGTRVPHLQLLKSAHLTSYLQGLMVSSVSIT